MVLRAAIARKVIVRAACLDQLCDGADTPPGQLREQDHPLNTIVLEERYICAHLCDGFDLHIHANESALV